MASLEDAEWTDRFRALEKPLYNVVLRMIWDAAESEDIVQEAFLRCWRRRQQVRAEGFKALVFRTALNLARNRRRQNRLWRMVGLSSIDGEIAHQFHRQDLFPAVVREAIDALPDRLKHVLLLSEMAGMTYTEIAATMGVKEGTVGSRRARALAILRERLETRGVRWDDCR